MTCPPSPKAGALANDTGERQKKMVDAEKFHLSEIVLHVFPARNSFVVRVDHLLHAKLAEAVEVGLNGWLSGEEELEILRGVCSTTAEVF